MIISAIVARSKNNVIGLGNQIPWYLPADLKYFKKTNDGKQILRDVMVEYMPSSIVTAQKQGFSAPDASWFKGESIDFVRSTLLDNNARIYDVIDKNTTQSLINEHLNGKKNRRLLIWSLLNINAWMELYL